MEFYERQDRSAKVLIAAVVGLVIGLVAGLVYDQMARNSLSPLATAVIGAGVGALAAWVWSQPADPTTAMQDWTAPGGSPSMRPPMPSEGTVITRTFKGTPEGTSSRAAST